MNSISAATAHKRRVLPVYVLVDNSASMIGKNEKQVAELIQSFAKLLVQVSSETSYARIVIKVAQFSNEAHWVTGPDPLPVELFRWDTLEPGASTATHKAIKLLVDDLATIDATEPIFGPLCVLITDGNCDDLPAFENAIASLNALPIARKAIRFSVAIGNEYSLEELLTFCTNSDCLFAIEGTGMSSLLSTLRDGFRFVSSVAEERSPTMVIREDAHSNRSENLPLPSEVSSDKNYAVFTDNMQRATERREYGEHGTNLDPVDCTLYAPLETCLSDDLLVQVYVHEIRRSDDVRKLARNTDSDSVERGSTSLGTKLPAGSRLSFNLFFPSLDIELPSQTLIWRGHTDRVTFVIPGSTVVNPRAVVGTVMVAVDSVPIGEITFKVRFTSDVVRGSHMPNGLARRYRRAFVSYASENRREVLSKVQMLSAAGIEYFQDVLDLDPGDRWERKLYSRIDESDVMFLFWSAAAKASEWVEREWRYGLEKKGDEYIRPVIIEGPPVPTPPDELKHLHFNDKVRYFIKAMEQ